MRQEKFLEVFDKLPTKRKQVLLGILRGDSREKIMADVEVPTEDALNQHKSKLYENFQIQVFQNEADDPRSGERKLPQLIALCAKYKPELISPNAALVSPSRPESLLFPNFSIYNPLTWVGRELIVRDFLTKLQGQTRLLWITGISGIGKTMLGECLASKTWESDPSFQWVRMEIEEQSPGFTQGAERLLAKLGDKDFDPQERNDTKRLTERLLQKLQTNRYWIQLDALELLLNPEQPTEFADAHWLAFLQSCLTESNFASRLVLTAQALPEKMVQWKYQHENTWYQMTLGGLSVKDQEALEFFDKYRIPVNETNQFILSDIGRIYEGHPLALRVIAGEIYDRFKGDVISYWKINRREFEQVERTLSQWLDETEHNEELDRQVRDRLKQSLKQLPPNASELLRCSAVYRRTVPKKLPPVNFPLMI